MNHRFSRFAPGCRVRASVGRSDHRRCRARASRVADQRKSAGIPQIRWIAIIPGHSSSEDPQDPSQVVAPRIPAETGRQLPPTSEHGHQRVQPPTGQYLALFGARSECPLIHLTRWDSPIGTKLRSTSRLNCIQRDRRREQHRRRVRPRLLGTLPSSLADGSKSDDYSTSEGSNWARVLVGLPERYQQAS